MKRNWCLMAVMLSFCASAEVYGYGEDGDYPIPYEARATHMMMNEARTDTHAAMANCGDKCGEGIDCYQQYLQPLYWDQSTSRASQFYAQLLTKAGCIQHDTPCTLVSTISADFPETCDGDPACACQEGKAACGSSGTSSYDRLSLFTGSIYYAENICGGGSIDCVSRLVNEDNSGNTACKWTWTGGKGNGHRWNLFGKDYNLVGVGADGYIVQNLGSGNKETNALTAGSHYSVNSKLWFRTHYYSTKEIADAVVSVGGSCSSLALVVGSKKNGVYGTSEVPAPGACTPYFYEAKDAEGDYVRFPTTGSLLYNCDHGWQKEAGKSCLLELNCGDNQHIYLSACEDNSDANCGAHGYDCKKYIKHWASGSCTSGNCVVAACENGYHVKDGACAADSPDNCGTVGKCSDLISGWKTGKCTNGECKVESCTDGKIVKDNQCVADTVTCTETQHVYQDGCEDDSLDNCGAHERKCSAEIAGWQSGKCTKGSCVVDACVTGKKVADNQCVDDSLTCSDNQHVYNNACEDNSLDHCGGHDNKCSEKVAGWAEGACEQGLCKASKCKDDYTLSNDKCVSNSTEPGDNDKPGEYTPDSSDSGCSGMPMNHTNHISIFGLLLGMAALYRRYRRKQSDV